MKRTHGSRMTNARYSRLGGPECKHIHVAKLEILERVGINVHDEDARAILERSRKVGT
jgi:trimethylamine:corrinoid methyltransferase-like protein